MSGVNIKIRRRIYIQIIIFINPNNINNINVKLVIG